MAWEHGDSMPGNIYSCFIFIILRVLTTTLEIKMLVIMWNSSEAAKKKKTNNNIGNNLSVLNIWLKKSCCMVYYK